jgi:hypothetical protein
MASGFKPGNENTGKKISGGLVMGGGILGLLPLGNVGNKLASIFYTANNFAGFYGVLEDMCKVHASVRRAASKVIPSLAALEKVSTPSRAKYCYVLDALGLALFMYANWNVFRAPKAQDLSKDKAAMEQVYNEAAVLVARQPERLQNFVATTVAAELHQSRSIKIDPRVMLKEIRAHAAALEHSPFLVRVQNMYSMNSYQER